MTDNDSSGTIKKTTDKRDRLLQEASRSLAAKLKHCPAFVFVSGMRAGDEVWLEVNFIRRPPIGLVPGKWRGIRTQILVKSRGIKIRYLRYLFGSWSDRLPRRKLQNGAGHG